VPLIAAGVLLLAVLVGRTRNRKGGERFGLTNMPGGQEDPRIRLSEPMVRHARQQAAEAEARRV
jgi:hypothetical protein